MLEMKFLRGWRCKEVKDYSKIGLRMMIVKFMQMLADEWGVDLGRVNVRLHYKNIKHRVRMRNLQTSKRSL